MARAKFIKHYLLLFLCPSLLPYPSLSTGIHIPQEYRVKSVSSSPVHTRKKKSICLDPTSAHYFEINAIKSEMMISAVQCDKSKEYNSKIHAWNGWRNPFLSKWFATHGGEPAYLKYTTELANKQSINDIKLFGREYCSYHKDIFTFDTDKGDTTKYIEDHNIDNGLPYKKCS